jgi:hypothetical protein
MKAIKGWQDLARNHKHPRRIGDIETAEWHELYDFYRALKWREWRPRLLALAAASILTPIAVEAVALYMDAHRPRAVESAQKPSPQVLSDVPRNSM